MAKAGDTVYNYDEYKHVCSSHKITRETKRYWFLDNDRIRVSKDDLDNGSTYKTKLSDDEKSKIVIWNKIYRIRSLTEKLIEDLRESPSSKSLNNVKTILNQMIKIS